jgi:GNAT superfamily N-acetyltransferase
MIPPIRYAGHGDAPIVASIVAEAFHTLDGAAWLVPDPAERTGILAAQFQLVAEHAIDHGTVHLLDDETATAVWLHRTTGGPPPPIPDYRDRLAAICGPHLIRFLTLDRLFDLHHPTEPHHHLAFLAVRPGWQDSGRGSTLLAHHHRHLDTTSTAAYLEASNPQCRALYLRTGYQSSHPFQLPDGTPFWPMWRPPHTPETTP